MSEIDHRLRTLKELTSITTQKLDATMLSEDRFDLSHQVEDLGVLIEASKRNVLIDSQKRIDAADNGISGLDKNDLGLLRHELENVQQQLNVEGRKEHQVDVTSDDQNNKLQQVTSELESLKSKLKEQETFELKRRQGFEQQLVIERKKMSEQLAKFASGVELYQSRSREIEKVKNLAVLESRQLISKFKAAHEEYRHRHTMTIQRVKKELQQLAAHVLDKARRAQMEKKEALQALRDVQNQLDELRQLHSPIDDETSQDKDRNTTASDVPMLVDIASLTEKSTN
jgi:vacuolar-type H+-ATPase subunit I/STV1